MGEKSKTITATMVAIISGGATGLGVSILIMSVKVGWTIFGIVITVLGAITFILSLLTGYGNMESRKVVFTCKAWQAPTFTSYQAAQSNCKKCNEKPLKPCTKYKCSSLGQSCELLNENSSGHKEFIEVIKYRIIGGGSGG